MPTHRDDPKDADSAQKGKPVRQVPSLKRPSSQADGHAEGGDTPSEEDGHLGATEDQVSDTSPPAGDAFEDEPKQG